VSLSPSYAERDKSESSRLWTLDRSESSGSYEIGHDVLRLSVNDIIVGWWSELAVRSRRE
jgi:hypothetical protein